MAPLSLRPLRAEDEPEAIAAQGELETDDFNFLLFWSPLEPWGDYLAQLERERCGVGLGTDRLPSTFLVAEVDGALVGRISIRHELNELFENSGGHIGYCVRPAFRRLGYATEILRQGLLLARGLGIERALVVCDENNPASMKVIEGLGGVFEDVREDLKGALVRRYWFA